MYLINSALHDVVRIVFLAIALVISTTGSATPSCIYDEIPQSIPTECMTLTIQNGNLRALSSVSFSHLNRSTNIKTLTLSDNGITEIGRDAMQNFPALEQLDASENSIESLDSAVFRSLPKLTNLYLQGNKISSISNSAFEGLEKLEVLRLDVNQLRRIDSYLSDVPSLKTLNLTSNKITEMSSDAFDGITKLSDLLLGYNQLIEMPEPLKDIGLRKLHVLNIRSNLINTPLNSSNLHYDYLEKLYLTNNDIPGLSSDVFKYLRRLQVLHLDFNRLTNMDALLVYQPQELEEIKLDNNQWDCKCNNTEVWELLRNQQNLTIVKRESTFCVTPTSSKNEVIFDFVSSCNREPLLSTAALTGIIVASAIIVTCILMTVCIYCIKRNCKRSRSMTVNPIQSRQPGMTATDSQVELPNHEYLYHATSPTDVSKAGDTSTLRSHIYDLPKDLCRDPSYINNKVLRLNLQKNGIKLKTSSQDKDLDSDKDYYLVPIEMAKTNRTRYDSDDGIVV